VNRNLHRRTQRGLSMIELMVGVAVGMFVVAGAIKLFVDYVGANKRQLVETRVNQEMRAAADIVARDLRRAGYWENASAGIAASSPYAVASQPSASEIHYAYARNADNVLDNNEQVGFQRGVTAGGIGFLQMQDGLTAGGLPNWQPLTDPGTLDVTTFTVTAAAPTLTNDMSKYCPCLYKLTCTAADMTDTTKNPLGPRTMTIPSYQVVLTGRAVSDNAIVRTINETVRVRNAVLSGGCPAP
jgi:prepilin peptidase dependent protein B